MAKVADRCHGLTISIQGLFEGDLIVYTFAAHLNAIAAIPAKYVAPEVPNPPIGALILCIQAVRCHGYLVPEICSLIDVP